MNEVLREELAQVVTSHRLVLFMKGSPRAPQCGFSARVVEILDGLGVEYSAVDVLASPELREGIKAFSEWPTIPQLYVGGRFVGGCDIVQQMDASGELRQLVGGGGAPASGKPMTVPVMEVSERAIEAFAASATDPREVLHLDIDARLEPALYFGPRQPSEMEVPTNGPILYMNPKSAGRADGVTIDFIKGRGFKIDNPNASPGVRQIAPTRLAELLERGAMHLFDVRPAPERAVASLAAAHPLDAAGQKLLLELDHDTPIAVFCHHGIRSQDAAERLVEKGYRRVYNLAGGIDAWSIEVDPSVPRY